MDILEAIDEVTAPVCGACGTQLPQAGPSLYFCDDECSARWHETQVEPLVGYREPWDRPEDFPPGVIPPEAFDVPGGLLLSPWGQDAIEVQVLRPMLSGDSVRLGEQFTEGLTAGLHPPAPSVTSTLGILQVSWQPHEFRLPRETGNLAADWRAARRALLAATTEEQRAAVRLRMESLAERQLVQNAELAKQLEHLVEPIVAAMAAFVEAGAAWLQQIGDRIRPFFEDLRRDGVFVGPPPADPRERALAARRNRNTGPERRGRAPRTIGRPSSAARR